MSVLPAVSWRRGHQLLSYLKGQEKTLKAVTLETKTRQNNTEKKLLTEIPSLEKFNTFIT